MYAQVILSVVVAVILGLLLTPEPKVETGLHTWEDHSVRVEKLLSQLRENFSLEKGKRKMITFKKKAHATTMRVHDFKDDQTRFMLVELPNNDRVLEVNKKEGWAWCESGISMDRLAATLLEFGVVPEIVPEIKSITLAGAISGLGIESSSWKIGMLPDMVIDAEVILGNGTMIHANKDHHADLWEALPGAYNTIALVTAAKIRVVKIQSRWVKLTYERTQGMDHFLLDHASDPSKPFAYIEGMRMRGYPDMFVWSTGTFADKGFDPYRLPGGSANVLDFSHFTHRPYYLEVERIWNDQLTQPGVSTYVQYMDINDYFFRHDRYGFWHHDGVAPGIVIRYWIGRLLLGKVSSARMSLIMRNYVLRQVQPHEEWCDFHEIARDYLLPVADQNATYFIDKHVNTHLPYMPFLWICPVQYRGKLQVDVGVYVPISYFQTWYDAVSTYRLWDEEAYRLGGEGTYYSPCYRNETEWWAVNNQGKYEGIREKYQASEVFPGQFEKLCAMGRKYATIQPGAANPWPAEKGNHMYNFGYFFSKLLQYVLFNQV